MLWFPSIVSVPLATALDLYGVNQEGYVIFYQAVVENGAI